MGAGFVQILGDVGAIVRSEVIPGIRVEFIPRSIGFGRKSQSWGTFLPVYASKRLLNSWSVQVMDMAPFPVMKGGLEGRRLLMVGGANTPVAHRRARQLGVAITLLDDTSMINIARQNYVTSFVAIPQFGQVCCRPIYYPTVCCAVSTNLQ